MTPSEFLASWRSPSPCLPVQTSGSTGTPKSMLVEKRRMLASARITCDFLGLRPGDTALLCLSPDYIAGKMMLVRSIERGLRLFTVAPSGHPLSSLDPPEAFDLSLPRVSTHGDIPHDPPEAFDLVAMVPLQVWNSLQVPAEQARLRQIHHLIIGGGPIDPALATALRDFPNAVWSTYGMTETLSHIALRRLNGPVASDWYTPLPGVSLSLSPDDCLVIDAPEVCPRPDSLGGHLSSEISGASDARPAPLVTHDIAELAPDGRFRILGRLDNVICTGGLKLQPERLEAQLRPHLAAPFLITSRPDTRLGQAVVLLTEGSPDEARQICQRILPRYHRPRHYLHVDSIPLTPTGKPARSAAALLAR